MADDRYKWLDGEAAERLLRGVPVDARSVTDGGRVTGGEARGTSGDPAEGPDARADARHGRDGDRAETAEMLAAALDALAAEHSGAPHSGQGVELPGEEAAVKAFRESHVGVLRSSSLGVVGGSRPGRRERRHRQEGVHGGRHPADGRRIPLAGLAGTPLRAGFAMAVAGCALGGVAVAAGTGVLPSPFGGGGTPAASVSPVISQDGDREEAAQGGDSSVPGNDGEDHGRGSERPSDRPSQSRPETGGATDGRHGGKDTPGEGGKKGHKGHGKHLSDAQKQALAREACKAYVENKLPSDARRKLENAAGGPMAVQKFCAKYGVGKGSGGDPGSGGGAVSGGDGGHSNSGGNADGGESGDGGDGDPSGGDAGDGAAGGGGPHLPSNSPSSGTQGFTDSGGNADGGSTDSTGPTGSATESTDSSGTPSSAKSAPVAETTPVG